jgi:hypothetical protein
MTTDVRQAEAKRSRDRWLAKEGRPRSHCEVQISIRLTLTTKPIIGYLNIKLGHASSQSRDKTHILACRYPKRIVLMSDQRPHSSLNGLVARAVALHSAEFDEKRTHM